jgi:hypothetical protein
VRRLFEAIFRLGLAFVMMASAARFAGAQTPAPAGASDTSEALKALDQVIEQNRKLEQQNRELMEQINTLRQKLAAQPAAAQPGTAQPVSQPNVAQTEKASEEQTATSSSQPDASDDDKTLLPKASEGSPAIFGEFNPGRGFNVARGEYGSLSLSGYMAARYLNQLPPDQTATDHLGRPIAVDPRQDFQFHRVMLFAQGWLFSPKFNYLTFVWTVQDTNQVAVGGALTYTFSKYLTLGMGWNAYPGTQSLQGSHPYWESYDRVMADEFFRPYFSQGVFGQGVLLPRLEYRFMVGNNNSNLDTPASKIDRKLSEGAALTWLPTTGEFGPRGAFGDYERHEKLATRFNLAYTYSPEERQTASLSEVSNNTTLRLADSLNVFDTGTFANGVTVSKARYRLVTAAAGMKYRGFWLQGEGYYRKLDQFVADGRLPVSVVRDTGFYVQLAQMIVPKRIELYGATSYVFSNYGRPKEFIVGGNYYPWDTRNLRFNAQLINVDQSPVSSTFGFYMGKITGQVVAIGFTALY